MIQSISIECSFCLWGCFVFCRKCMNCHNLRANITHLSQIRKYAPDLAFLRAFCAHGRSHIFWHPGVVYSDIPFYFIEHRQSKVNIWSSMKLKIENKQKQLLESTGRTPWWDSLGNMALEEVFLSFDVYRFFLSTILHFYILIFDWQQNFLLILWNLNESN